MNIWSTTKDEWLISPILDLGTGPTSYQVEFDAGLTDFNGSGTDLMGADDSLAVVISLDSGDTWSSANILKLYTAGNPPSNSGESVVIDLSAYSGKVKIGFYAASTVSNTDYNVYIDNFAFNPLATCPKPTALAVAELTTTSADFYWMENGTATSWQVEFGVSGYTAGTAPKTVYSMDSITLSGLSSNTVYDAYVRAICSSSDSSAWVGPISFTTLCAPYTAPYFDDFESAATSSTPACWTEYKTYSSSYAEVRASSPFSGSNAINMYSSGASTSGSDSLILATPQLSDLIAGDKQISFQVNSSSTSNALLIGTVASPDPTATFNSISTITFSSTNSYKEVIIPFTTANGYNGTDQYIVLVSNLGSTYTYIRIDDFNYSVIPTCPKPIGLTATAITSSSVSFNWTESGSAASWQIQYDTTGFPIGTGIKNVVALDSVNETGLIPETDYDVYVRSICGSNDSSAWTGPISFRTLCGSLSAPFVENFNSFVPNCWNEAGNGTPNSGITSIGSGDWGSTNYLNSASNGKGAKINLFSNVDKEWIITPTLDLTAGGPLELVISAGVTDYNGSTADNMGADDEVLVLISEDNMLSWDTLLTWNSSNQPPTAGADYRISLAGYTSNNNIVAIWATDGSINNTEDYDFHIGKFELRTVPSCLAVTANSGTNSLTFNSAEVSWVENGTATSWRVEYDTIGYAAGTARNTIVVTDTFSILTGLSGSTNYDWKVSALCSVNDSSAFVGNSFTTPASCLAPTANSGTNGLTATSAEVSWIESASATSWRVEYDTLGYAAGTARNTVVVTDTFAIITGLSANTDYEWNVSALCSVTDSSTFVGNSFYTGYCQVSTTYSGDYLSSLVSSGANTNISYTATSNAAGSYSDETVQSISSFATGSYDITSTYVGGSNGVNVWVDWNNDLDFDDANELVGSSVGSAASKTISITTPGTAVVGNYRMRVRAQYGSTANPPSCGNVSYGTTLDFTLIVSTPPACLAPTAQSLDSLASTAVKVSWLENGTATQWEIEYDTAGFVIGTGRNTVTVNTDTFKVLTGLSANTNYDWYVRAICSPTTQSTYAGAASFFTGYCQVSTTYSGDYLSSLMSTGASTNVSYTASSNPTGSYSDQTAQSISSYASATFDITTTYVGGSNGVNVWVDWNNDLDFDDANELLGSTAGSAASQTISITTPATAALGNYRMRVRAQYGSTANPPSCGNVSYGTTLDFNITIVTPPTCLAPSNLSLDSIAISAAKVSWLENGTATQWEIEYDTMGFVLGTGRNTVTVNTDTFKVITGLTANTAYDWYVRAICSPTDQSTFAGAGSFRTNCNTVSSFPFFENFETTISPNVPNCWSNQLISGSNNWKTTTGSGGDISAPYAGTNWLEKDYNNSESILFSPEFDLTAIGTNGRLNVWLHRHSSADVNDQYIILINNSKSLTGADTLLSLYSKTTIAPTVASTGWYNYNINIPSTYNTSTGAYIMFVGKTSASFSSYDLGIDNYTVEAIPACVAPTNLTLDSIATTAAKVSWVENGTATQWEIEYDTVGFVLGTGRNTVTVNTDTFKVITGLTANTTYDWYVKAICSPTVQSTFTGPSTFTTSCATFTAPFLETFNGNTTPSCWSQSAVLDGPWVFGAPGFGWNTQGCSFVPTDHTGNSGSYAALDFSGSGVTDVVLEMPVVDVSTLTNPFLEFYFVMCGTGYTPINKLYVEAFDGTAFVSIDSIQQGTNGWMSFGYDLSNYKYNTNEVKIRFRASSGANTVSMYFGDQAIDDVSIKEAPADNLAVTAIVSPTGGCGQTATSSVTITIDNVGAVAQSGFSVGYSLNGVAITPETHTASIAANASANYTFTTTANLSTAGNYEIVAYTLLANDVNNANDTSRSAIISLGGSTSFPYVESFENGPAGWVADGDANSSWALGAPTGVVINSASNGTQAWVTNLTGDYSDAGVGSVNSPCFDFTNVANPTISLDIWYDIESQWDGAIMQTSTDNGATWNLVGAKNDPINWYNDTADVIVALGLDPQGQAWTGDGSGAILGSGGWINASHELNGMGGLSSVRVRILFASDAGTVAEGFAFDNVRVFDSIPPVVTLPYYPIGTVNTEDATTGVADSLGVFCWISGTVAGVDLDGNTGISFTIIDQSGTNPEGMNIYNFADVSNYVVTEGDSIMLRGEIQQFNGLTELFPDSIRIIATGKSLPAHTLVSSLSEATESQLIEIKDFVVITPSGNGSYNFAATNGTDTLTIRVDADTDVNDSLSVAGRALVAGDTICSMKGIGGQFDNSNPYLSGYQIFPMRFSDIDTTSCITIIGIKDAEKNTSSIQFFPNPNNGQFKLQIENVTAPNSTLEIVNIQGQVVYNENLIINGSLSKDININVEKGIYFVRLLNKNGVKVEKLIIE
jgi:hypothetical protein